MPAVDPCRGHQWPPRGRPSYSIAKKYPSSSAGHPSVLIAVGTGWWIRTPAPGRPRAHLRSGAEARNLPRVFHRDSRWETPIPRARSASGPTDPVPSGRTNSRSPQLGITLPLPASGNPHTEQTELADETSIWAQELAVSDELTGDDLRLVFLLYDGPVPDTPTRENAYRSVHLWVDVQPQPG